MNDLDERLREAFAARADSTRVDHRADVGSPLVPMATGRSRSWAPILGIAAVTVAVTVAGLTLISRVPAADESPATLPPPAPTTAVTTPRPTDLGTNPLLPEVFPAFPTDDPRQGLVTADYSGFVSFESTSAARAIIGRIESGRLVDPMAVSVYADADVIPFDSAADEVVIDGTTYERHRVESVPPQWTLVLRGETDAVITGADPEAFVAVAGAIPVADVTLAPDSVVSFSLSPLPAGYEAIVEPVTFPVASPVVEITFGSAADDSFGVVQAGRMSDLLLQAPGSSFRQVDVNGVSGWATDVPTGAAALVIWQVAPSTWAETIASTPTEALDLARSVTFVDERTWQATYNVIRPENLSLQTRSTELQPTAAIETTGSNGFAGVGSK